MKIRVYMQVSITTGCTAFQQHRPLCYVKQGVSEGKVISFVLLMCLVCSCTSLYLTVPFIIQKRVYY